MATAATNLFATAPVLAPAAKATKASTRVEHHVEGLTEYSAIKAMIGSLESLLPAFEAQVKDSALGIFTAEAIKYSKKPESFNLVDDQATGQYQLRKRSSASALAPDEIAILEALGIPTETKTTTEDRFFFNPAILSDQVAMEKISKALIRIPELKGMDIIQHQAAVSSTIVSDDAIETACKTVKAKEQLTAALKIIGVSALKSMFDSQEMKDALTVLEAAGIKLVPDAEPKKASKKK